MSQHIPRYIKVAIAEAILAFSRLELNAEYLLWDIKGLSFDEGKTLSEDWPTRRKFEALEKELKVLIGPTLSIYPRSFWRAIRMTTKTRNLVAHGAWITIKGIPSIMSHRFEGPPGEVVSESFPIERLRALKRITERLDKIMVQIQIGIAKQHESPVQPPHPV